MSNSQAIVAANVRARLGWKRISGQQAATMIGMKQRAFANKLAGAVPFRPDELDKICALVLDLSDPGPLYKAPADFPTLESVSACTQVGYGLTSDLGVAA